MTISRDQITELLQVVASYDNRRVTVAMVDAWIEQGRRGSWHIQDALNAVHSHFQGSKATLYPLDITERIRAARNLPQLPGQPNGQPACVRCDEQGFVKDSYEKYGWVIRCRHDPQQLLARKPDDVHEAARLIKEGRALEEQNPGYYRRAHDAPHPSEPRGRP